MLCERYKSLSVATKVAAWARGERPGGLTERDAEVIRLVAEGLSKKEIEGRFGGEGGKRGV